MDREVSEYIKKQRDPQKEICKKLRRIILKAFPKIDEKMKMGVVWYGKYYILGLKNSVNLGFSVKKLSKREMDNFKGTGKFMRHLKFKNSGDINEKEILRLLKLVDKKAECASCYR